MNNGELVGGRTKKGTGTGVSTAKKKGRRPEGKSGAENQGGYLEYQKPVALKEQKGTDVSALKTKQGRHEAAPIGTLGRGNQSGTPSSSPASKEKRSGKELSGKAAEKTGSYREKTRLGQKIATCLIKL